MNEKTLDLRQVHTKHDLHNLLASELDFPDWYGNNWDAFWDVIRDIDLVTLPKRLILLGFKELSEKLPKDTEVLQKCFADLKQEYPSIVCEVIYS